MDHEARECCLRAVRLIARSARLCAVTDPATDQYRLATQSAERMIERAQSYFETFRAGHAPTERPVRLVLTAVAEARAVATVLTGSICRDSDDLERMAGKIERAIARVDNASV